MGTAARATTSTWSNRAGLKRYSIEIRSERACAVGEGAKGWGSIGPSATWLGFFRLLFAPIGHFVMYIAALTLMESVSRVYFGSVDAWLFFLDCFVVEDTLNAWMTRSTEHETSKEKKTKEKKKKCREKWQIQYEIWLVRGPTDLRRPQLLPKWKRKKKTKAELA